MKVCDVCKEEILDNRILICTSCGETLKRADMVTKCHCVACVCSTYTSSSSGKCLQCEIGNHK